METNPIPCRRILLVDDSPSVLAILSGILSEFSVSTAASGEQALELAAREPFDLILLDVRMPGMDGYETCRRLKQREETAATPVIFVTGLNETADEAQGFAMGAVDFISKPPHPVIVRARVGVHLELKAARDQLQRIAASDGLTGLANRRHFESQVQQEWQRALRHGDPLSLLMIDVDHFKAYNDHYGHPAGDACLKRVAECLRSSIRRTGDLAARYGGEEFICLVPELPHAEVTALAQCILNNIAAARLEHAASPVADHVTASLGLATTTPQLNATATWHELLSTADQALYRAKREGRNRLVAVVT